MARRLFAALAFSALALLATILLVAPGQAEPPTEPKDAPAQAPAATAEPQEAKPKRPPIYDTEANGQELIAAAVKRAALEHKHVLVEWGGNWCGWCYKLHDVFHNDELVHPIVAEEFELVLVDSTNNRELMESYGGKDTKYAYPHLTILDAQGKVLTNQETGSLEIGPKHDPQAVAAFLRKWQPEKLDAEDLLAAALQSGHDRRQTGARARGHAILRLVQSADPVLGRAVRDLLARLRRPEARHAADDPRR